MKIFFSIHLISILHFPLLAMEDSQKLAEKWVLELLHNRIAILHSLERYYWLAQDQAYLFKELSKADDLHQVAAEKMAQIYGKKADLLSVVIEKKSIDSEYEEETGCCPWLFKARSEPTNVTIRIWISARTKQAVPRLRQRFLPPPTDPSLPLSF